MSITYTMTWAAGIAGSPTGGFTLTDDKGNVTPYTFGKNVDNIPNPVVRAVADELVNQGGSATGTVTVTIA